MRRAVTVALLAPVLVLAQVPTGKQTISDYATTKARLSALEAVVYGGAGSSPTITAVSPALGTSGTQVAVAGVGFFKGVASGKLGTAPLATYVVNSDTLITATVPTVADGSYQFAFTMTDGTTIASPTTFTVSTPVAAPSIASFGAAPTSIASGQSSTLSWTASGYTSLAIDHGVGAVTGSSKSVAPVATTGYTLTATNGAGSVTASTTVTVIPAPTCSGLSPASGAVGTSVALSGTNLSGAAVAFGTTASTPTATSAGSVSAPVPTLSSGAYSVKVTTSGGSATCGTFTVAAAVSPPTIASFTATPASIAAGQSSTLAWSASGQTSLSIDHSVGTVTGTSKAVSPAATTGYTLTATNTAGSATATATVTVLAAPTCTALSVPSGPVGTSVTLTGTNLAGAAVAFNGTASTPTSTAASSLVAPVPASATTGAVTVSTTGGSASCGTFTVTTGTLTSSYGNDVTCVVGTACTFVVNNTVATGSPSLAGTWSVDDQTSNNWPATAGTRPTCSLAANGCGVFASTNTIVGTDTQATWTPPSVGATTPFRFRFQSVSPAAVNGSNADYAVVTLNPTSGGTVNTTSLTCGSGTDYYAAQGGSGTTCSSLSPCSVSTALGNLSGGDTLYLSSSGGNITARLVLTSSHSGTAASPTCVKNKAGETVVVKPTSGSGVVYMGSNQTSATYVTTPTSDPCYLGRCSSSVPHHINFIADAANRLDFDGSGGTSEAVVKLAPGTYPATSNASMHVGAHHIGFQKVRIHGSPAQGLDLYGDYLKCIDCEIDHNGTADQGTATHGIYLNARKATFIRGRVHHNVDNGWHCWTGEDLSDCSDNVFQGTEFDHNGIGGYDSSQTSTVSDAIAGSIACGNRNTLSGVNAHDNLKGGFLIHSGAQNTVFKGASTITSNGGPGIEIDSGNWDGCKPSGNSTNSSYTNPRTYESGDPDVGGQTYVSGAKGTSITATTLTGNSGGSSCNSQIINNGTSSSVSATCP